MFCNAPLPASKRGICRSGDKHVPRMTQVQLAVWPGERRRDLGINYVALVTDRVTRQISGANSASPAGHLAETSEAP